MVTIAVAGIPRSGSTWLFNAARCMAERRDGSLYSAWIDDFDPSRVADIRIVKLHEPDDELAGLADKVLLSHRDLRDIAASAASMGWAETAEAMVAGAASARRSHDFWSPRASVDIRYDDIRDAPADALQRIARSLEWEFDDAQLAAILEAIPQSASPSGARGYDRVTLLHDNHVNDGRPGRWRDQLDPDVSAAIWSEHADWLRAHGYRQS